MDYIMGFSDLSTTVFAGSMRHKLREVYATLYPEGTIMYLDDTDDDQHRGIDVVITTSNCIIKIQEKIRKISYYRKYGMQICIEIANGNGTPGEWDYIDADYYLLSYADDDGSLPIWVLLDVKKIKDIASKSGGIQYLGEIRHNARYGSATFVAIPIKKIKESIIVICNNVLCRLVDLRDKK
jgi:hypothetical protein